MLPITVSLAYNVEDYEEEAGYGMTFFFNPADNVYMLSGESGTWLTGTPIFGNFFLTASYNGIEETAYSSAGMSFRVMPHWCVAPFVGGGGSYNYSFSGEADEYDSDIPEQGKSYWAGHGEAGIRIWMQNETVFFEGLGRYTSVALDGDHDYWSIGVGYGVRY